MIVRRRAEKEPPGSAYLLDTSAVLALLEDEDGADRVEQILRNERVLLPFLFAVRHNAVLVHKDPEYQPLEHQVRQEILPYRSRRRVKE